MSGGGVKRANSPVVGRPALDKVQPNGPAAKPPPAAPAKATGWGPKARTASAPREDFPAPAARRSTTRPDQNATALADTLGELKGNLEKATKAFEHVSKAKHIGGEALEGFTESTENISGALGAVAEKLGDAEAALRIPQKTRELNQAFDAYQRDPSPANAATLKDATEAWRAVIAPIAEKIPNPAVRAEVVGMLDIATKAVGNFAVLVSDYSRRAVRASESGDPRPDAPEAAAPSTVREPEPESDVAAAHRDLGGFVQGKMSQWMGRAGVRELPPAMASKYDEVQQTVDALEKNRAARAANLNPFKTSSLKDQGAALELKLIKQFSELEGAAFRASPRNSLYLGGQDSLGT